MSGLLLLLVIILTVGSMPFLLTYAVARATEHENAHSSNLNAHSSLSVGTALWRLMLVLVSYFLCGYGLVAVSLLALLTLDSAPHFSRSLLPLLGVYACLCHIALSIGWLRNRRANPVWSISGATAGAISVVVFPVSWIFNAPHLAVFAVLPEHLREWILGAPFLVLTACLLAFHLGSPTLTSGGQRHG